MLISRAASFWNNEFITCSIFKIKIRTAHKFGLFSGVQVIEFKPCSWLRSTNNIIILLVSFYTRTCLLNRVVYTVLSISLQCQCSPFNIIFLTTDLSQVHLCHCSSQAAWLYEVRRGANGVQTCLFTFCQRSVTSPFNHWLDFSDREGRSRRVTRQKELDNVYLCLH